MKVVVTGLTGFIGSNLARRLLKEGLEVICAGRSLHKLGSLSDKARPVYLDIEDKEAIRETLKRERPHALFHCAALVNNSSLRRLRRVNVEGTRNVLDACLQEGVERVIYTSSIAVINGNDEMPLTEGSPYSSSNRYGQSKIEAEKAALYYRSKGLRIAIFRPPMVYGEHEPHALFLLVNLIRRRLFPILGEGKNRLHLVGIENLLDALTLPLKNEEAYNGTYIVADREILSMKELLEFIADVVQAGPPLRIPSVFIPLLVHLPFAGRRFRSLLKDRVYSIEGLQKRLGYTPAVSVYEGLRKAVLSYRDKETA